VFRGGVGEGDVARDERRVLERDRYSILMGTSEGTFKVGEEERIDGHGGGSLVWGETGALGSRV